MDKPENKILVVDDDEDTRVYISSILSREGYSVHGVGDGSLALGYIAEHQDIGLVILDWLIPGVDGLQILYELEQAECCAERPVPPVLMMTVKSNRDEVEIALRAGAVDFLPKPVDKKSLLFKVDNILRHRQEVARMNAAQRKPVSLHSNTVYTVLDVDESGMALESTFPIPEDSLVFVQSVGIASKLDLPREHRFSLKVKSCSGIGNRYRVETGYVGFPPPLLLKIKQITQKSGWVRK